MYRSLFIIIILLSRYVRLLAGCQVFSWFHSSKLENSQWELCSKEENQLGGVDFLPSVSDQALRIGKILLASDPYLYGNTWWGAISHRKPIETVLSITNNIGRLTLKSITAELVQKMQQDGIRPLYADGLVESEIWMNQITSSFLYEL